VAGLSPSRGGRGRGGTRPSLVGNIPLSQDDLSFSQQGNTSATGGIPTGGTFSQESPL
jgi:hypothetical protein